MSSQIEKCIMIFKIHAGKEQHHPFSYEYFTYNRLLLQLESIIFGNGAHQATSNQSFRAAFQPHWWCTPDSCPYFTYFLLFLFFIILGRYLPWKAKSQKELHRSQGCFRNSNMLKTEHLSLELLVTFSELLPRTAILTHFTVEEM